VLACAATLCAPLAHAASPCKGLDRDACGGNNACTWIDSYKTSKGATVSAYCRARPKAAEKKPPENSSQSAPDDRKG